jgi:hypothetical protein
MHGYASRLVPGTRDYTARFARYAAVGDRFTRAGSFAQCTLYGPVLGYAPWWLVSAGAWIPSYGLGYVGGSRCGYGYGYGLAAHARPIIRRPTFTRPVRPPTAGDTATKPRVPRLRPRDAGRDSTERKSRRLPPRIETEDETVVDVTRETRDLARRRERAMRGARDFRPPSGGERTGREWSSQRDDAGRASDRVTRTRVEHESRARSESSRGEARSSEPRSSEPRSHEPRSSEPRASEPRREAPQRYERPEPRSEPRSEPRAEPRPQPPPRSEPVSRPEPRGERPRKP